MPCAYSTLTPYPGTLTWYEMKKANRIVSFDWTMYDQGHVVYRPAQMSGDDLRIGVSRAYGNFYATSSIAKRFPMSGKRHRAQWVIYNLMMRRGSQTENIESIAAPDGGAGYGSDASHSANQTGMARSRCWRPWAAARTAPELTYIDPSSIPCRSFIAARNSWRVLKFVRKTLEHAARHHCHIRPVNAARRHALVRAFDDDQRRLTASARC